MSKIICPDDCSTMLSDFAFSKCAPIINPGEVGTVYLFNIGYPVVANPRTDPAGFIAEMALRVSNTAPDANAIRELVCIGEKPEPESNKIKMSGGREVTTSKNHSLIFDIDETSQENRDAQRQMECANKFLIMYEVGDFIYGGQENIGDGIECSISADLISPRDITALEYIHCVAKWSKKFTPTSCINPLI